LRPAFKYLFTFIDAMHWRGDGYCLDKWVRHYDAGGLLAGEFPLIAFAAAASLGKSNY
jgi:hypothetical protein